MYCVETVDLYGLGSKICNDSQSLKNNLDDYLSVLDKINKETSEDYEYYKSLTTHIKILNKLAELSDETGKLLQELPSKLDNYSGRGING